MRNSLLLVFVLICSASLSIAGTPETWFAQAEVAYQQFDNQEALRLFRQVYEAEPDYPNILFRLTRSHIDVGEDFEDNGDESAKQHYEQALNYARLALEESPDSVEAHLGIATAFGRMALFSGGKQKVRYSRDVKMHLDRALELDPTNAKAHAALGVYHREVASLSWFLRRFAVKLFGGLPKVSVKESRQHLEQAVQLQPDWTFAHLELGKTLWKLDKKDAAWKEWDKALSCPQQDHRDPAYQTQAKELLSK